MADAVVKFLIKKLTRLVEEEVELLNRADGEVKSLISELNYMNVFLENSQGKRKEHPIVALVVSQIRDVAHEAEDVIDTYVDARIRQERMNQIQRVVGVVTRGVDHLCTLHNVAAKIKEIRKSIDEIFRNKKKTSKR